LYAAHYEAVWGVGFTFVQDSAAADDLAQDVFVWIWEHRTALAITNGWRAYLLRAARNRAFNVLRHHRVVQESAESWPNVRQAAGVGSGPADASALVLTHELATVVQRAIDALPERQRLAYTLRVQNGCTYAETARLMEISEKGVEISLGRAVKALRNALEGYR
jgi:RNA polymerase sigma-70 factor (ECF subfamily)